jgi:multidrug efflux pump subunit AcrA (membrane-fusion protein)
MIIPITALKVAGETYTVLTVEEGVLVARDVELGTLLGDKVVITSGVTLDTPIVIDARGLRVGQNVTIK